MLYKTLTHSVQSLTNQLWKLSNMINMIDWIHTSKEILSSLQISMEDLKKRPLIV